MSRHERLCKLLISFSIALVVTTILATVIVIHFVEQDFNINLLYSFVLWGAGLTWLQVQTNRLLAVMREITE